MSAADYSRRIVGTLIVVLHHGQSQVITSAWLWWSILTSSARSFLQVGQNMRPGARSRTGTLGRRVRTAMASYTTFAGAA
jgi:hypothetical protein